MSARRIAVLRSTYNGEPHLAEWLAYSWGEQTRNFELAVGGRWFKGFNSVEGKRDGCARPLDSRDTFVS